jgi:hypothetical protein
MRKSDTQYRVKCERIQMPAIVCLACLNINSHLTQIKATRAITHLTRAIALTSSLEYLELIANKL